VDFITRKPPGEGQNEKFGKLCVLFKWYLEDPVDETEKRRNNRIYEWQVNMNPFIDHPEWVTAIWEKRWLCD
jgi:endonuclease I